MSIEASSWTTSKSIWPSRQQYLAQSFSIFLHHQGPLQHLPLEKQVPEGSASSLLGDASVLGSNQARYIVRFSRLQRLLVLYLDRGGCILSEIIVKRKNVSG
jgi:hypothetical protein